ncbi:hypothetical protein SELMODRAFT_116290 [Selaginella moellendorffii]|uniref:Pentacotripeptide-repeat region of PRORP domain-containing protein n=2 Tax=Selaginella moellendorffii TaxID=88036 RepID=D8SG74_SELML|nr:hypothetical protein SELMODRAFT_116290 [Selaginella moellendorffii]
MYGKCGDLDAASEVFGKLDPLHVAAWSALLGAYANSENDAVQALELYKRMQLEGVRPDSVTFVTCLKACTVEGALGDGRKVHAHIRELGLETDIYAANALINMYGKCRSPEDAFQLFSRMESPNVVSWTSVIGNFAQYGHLGRESVLLFRKMELEGIRPNLITMVAVLRACNLTDGRQVHGYVLEAGMSLDTSLGNALVDMYCKTGGVDEADVVLREMPKRDVISWNIMISGYAQSGDCKEGLRCLWRMQQDGLSPTKVTYATLLNACSSEEDLGEGKSIHRSVVDMGLDRDEVVKSFLLGMYGKCGSLEDVKRSSCEVHERNTIAWNTIIGAYARYSDHFQALRSFQQMQLEGVKADAVTFVLMLGTCSSPAHLAQGILLHDWISQLGFESIIVHNSLTAMYAKCGSLDAARKMFEEMPSRNSVSWNSLMSAAIQHGCHADAHKFFQRMKLEGSRPDEVTCISMLDACTKQANAKEGSSIHQMVVESGFDKRTGVANALIFMYAKLGDHEAARNVFDAMAERNTVSWNTILAAYVEKGLNRDAVEMFWKMDVARDKVTYVAALDACSGLAGGLAHGKLIHGYMLDHGFSNRLDTVAATALVNMYGKCGSLQEARKIFDGMLHRDVVTWTSLIVAYAQHSEIEQALKLVKIMEQEGVKVDDVVFLSILSGCDHSGLLEEGCKYFVSMIDDYGISPRLEHYNCIIDVLGRAGHLDLAEKLVDRLPSRSDSKVWMTLLAACRMHGNPERGKRAARRITLLDPSIPAAYVVLSNIYTQTQAS